MNDGVVAVVRMTEEAVGAAAAVHLRTLPESRSALMGPGYVRSFIDWFRHPGHGGIALAGVAETGELVAYVVGAPLGYPRQLSRDLRWPSLAAVAIRPWLFLKREFSSGLVGRLRLTVTGRLQEHIDLGLPGPTMSLVAMGVLPAFRRTGIGRRLLQEFERCAVEMKMRSMHLSTGSDNTAARQFYESHGWRPLSKSADKVHYGRIL
jgi:ribosomal protein S18 acetylase RimI-like enzyme